MIELGWLHAGLAIVAVIGVSMGSIIILNLISILSMEMATSHDLDKSFPLAHMVNFLPLACILVPAPAAIGIIIWRRRLFFEPPNSDRGMSLPAMVAVAVIGLWWLMPASSILPYTFVNILEWMNWFVVADARQ